MKITIEFNTDNASFQDEFLGGLRLSEVDHILRQVRVRIFDEKHPGGALMDSNGNTVGHVEVESDD